MPNTPLQVISKHKIVPVLVVENVDRAAPLVEALVKGGLPIAEVTFRTDAAEKVIRKMADISDLCIGAGTVLSAEQVDQAYQAGSQFIVSPGFNPKVVRRCLDLGLPVFPGVSNPTDLDMALDHGLEVVKFFPAEALGGVPMLKALTAPYRMMQFLPTGGINPQNLKEYLRLSQVVACGGSWMVKPDWISEGKMEAVTKCVQDAIELVESE